jgi:hypothetical protein
VKWLLCYSALHRTMPKLIPPIVRWLDFESENFRPAETRLQLVEMYGEGVMNEGNVRKWCRLFN